MSTPNIKVEETNNTNKNEEVVIQEPVTDKEPAATSAAENKNDTTAEKVKNGPENVVKPVSRPPYIPPHLMGRDLNNPAQDMIGTGRRVQKPRLGVKVPYRNLTSQIVSQDEIAQEILERSLRKYSYSDVPEGGDVFFAMKLTHRLANKITPANETPDKSEINIKNIENVPIETPVKSTEKPKEIEKEAKNSSKDPLAPDETEEKSDSQNESYESKADQLYAEISSTLGEECKITKPVKLSSSSKNGKVNGLAPTEPELDNDTLLAILEGTSDVSDVSLNTSSTSKSEVKQRKKRIKPMLDPSVEKELALKQLMDFETKKNEDKLKKNAKKSKFEEDGNQQTNNIEDKDKIQDGLKTDPPKSDVRPKSIKKSPFNCGSMAPKRFPKKYQKIIKRQLRSSKLKVKTASPDQQKKLPEVPEVQIAIDRYIKTYASKRKQKPDQEEKPEEKKLKEDNQPQETSIEIPKKSETPVVEPDENRKDSNVSVDEEIKENESPIAKSKANPKVMREINRLLGDEGAINMIYSIEQKRLPSNNRDVNVLPSLRRKKKDLMLKTKLVKNAVLRLSMSPGQVSSPGRVRRTSPDLAQTTKSTSPSRKASMESIESNMSEPSPKVRKVAAEASRIIRRHSSSSAYSSDEDESDTKNKADKSNVSQGEEGKSKSSRTESRNRTEVIPENNNNEPVKEKSTEKDSKDVVNDVEMKELPSQTNSIAKRKESKEIQNDKNSTDASVMPYAELVEKLSLKEITLRRYDHLVQIILTSSSTKMKNAMNTQVLNELTSVLHELQTDENCRTVLFTSIGSSFCQGIDLQALICNEKSDRDKVIEEYIQGLMNFTKSLSQFQKVLIAGVHGSAVGLGVTMLPFFDMVFASDKATFYTPYVKLGQIPEAAATLTLPHLLGNAVTSELLFGCRMLTASEALQFGLVTRILWPDKFNEELLPLARGISGHSLQAVKATKTLLRQGMNEKLDEQLKTESKILQEHWSSEECQERFRNYLQQEALLQNN